MRHKNPRFVASTIIIIVKIDDLV